MGGVVESTEVVNAALCANEVGVDERVGTDGAIVTSDRVFDSDAVSPVDAATVGDVVVVVAADPDMGELEVDEVGETVRVATAALGSNEVGVDEMVGTDGAFDPSDTEGDPDADTTPTVGDVVVAVAADTDMGELEGAMVRHASWGMMKHELATSFSVKAQ